MFRIGYRTAKTAVGTAVAILIAQWLGLENFASAGILTILCIQDTKKKSLKAAWSRFLACLLAIVFASILFELLFYHPLIIGLLLLFFIPTTVMLKITQGIVTSSVIILHIYSAYHVTLDLIVNELGIIAIGIGIALLANLYMPSVENKLIAYQEQIEENFHRIFSEIVRYLRTNEDRGWAGQEITEVEELINEAKTLAFKDVENHFLRHENLYYLYFKMREKQFDILQRLLPLVTSISTKIEQREMVADFMEELSEHIHPGNTALLYLKKLYDMKLKFEEMDLPKTREEFEARAALYQFIKEMEDYLLIKSSFKGIRQHKENEMMPKEAN
ncbi:aromatic acid exporter family protein [Bacillus sp. SCS-153A]|uniref:aromatic acid exporter family protein n=1 Tax=Rossellomorea sedimentorum TaxID=3115294 RepID=UPI0039062E79